MLKWKQVTFETPANGEKVEVILSGQSGKNRVVKFFMTGDRTANTFLRMYRDAEQIVNFECDLLTTNAPMLPVDLPLGEGQNCSVGMADSTGGALTRTFAIGYEETG